MPVLRPCSGALATALASGQRLWSADIFFVNLLNTSTYLWTSWDSDLKVGVLTYTSSVPWLRRSKWNVTNTIQVPELEIIISANNAAPNLKSESIAGLFDGATVNLSRVFMPTPGDTATLGAIALFAGIVGAVQVSGSDITMKVKGKNNLLDRPAPRNTFQATCLHTFCDSGCTLSRATFTASFVVGTSPAPTRTFIPWTTAPGTPSLYTMGSLTMTSGSTNGQTQSIVKADATGITLAYPLSVAPAHLDTFSAFQGCDKTLAGAGAGGTNCTANSNVVNFRGFPYVPPSSTAAKGSF